MFILIPFIIALRGKVQLVDASIKTVMANTSGETVSRSQGEVAFG